MEENKRSRKPVAPCSSGHYNNSSIPGKDCILKDFLKSHVNVVLSQDAMEWNVMQFN